MGKSDIQQETTEKVSPKQLVMQLPFQIFLLVAGADGKIDAKEIDKFLQTLKGHSNCQSPHVAQIYIKTMQFYETFRKQYVKGLFLADMDKVQLGIRAINKILPELDRKLFKEDLYRLAEKIAKSSGGLAGIGAIGNEEKSILQQLQGVFLEPDKTSNAFKQQL